MTIQFRIYKHAGCIGKYRFRRNPSLRNNSISRNMRSYNKYVWRDVREDKISTFRNIIRHCNARLPFCVIFLRHNAMFSPQRETSTLCTANMATNKRSAHTNPNIQLIHTNKYRNQRNFHTSKARIRL